MIKVGIVGGAGYTAGELIRILLRHPKTEIIFVHSKSNAGQPLENVHQDLAGDTDLVFEEKFTTTGLDVLFLCLGHGESRQFLTINEVPPDVKIIDLSEDFRLKSTENDFVYGLPELNQEAIKKATHIANPGCFATAIQLALLPLANAGQLKEDIHIQGITGSTGAGQKLTETSHFSWRNNNLSVYKAFSHQHLREIRQNLIQLQPSFSKELHFIPVRGDFTRGIFATLYTACELSLESARELYENYYASHPFVTLTRNNPNLKQVVNTNKAILYLEKHASQLLIVSMIDNLLKGASGQAVQNMNLFFGLDQCLGLKLKASYF